MISNISNIFSEEWANNGPVKLGGLFGIKWLKLADLIFVKTNHLTNPLNEHQPDGPVKVCRDTQELPQDVGLKLCLLFDQEKNYGIINNTPKHWKDIENVEQLKNSQTIHNRFNNMGVKNELKRQESIISSNSYNSNL